MLGAALSIGYTEKKHVSPRDAPVMSGWQVCPQGSQCGWGSLPAV